MDGEIRVGGGEFGEEFGGVGVVDGVPEGESAGGDGFDVLGGGLAERKRYGEKDGQCGYWKKIGEKEGEFDIPSTFCTEKCLHVVF